MLDPTKLVFPPCGRIPSFQWLHSLTASATCSVDVGSTTKPDDPEKEWKINITQKLAINDCISYLHTVLCNLYWSTELHQALLRHILVDLNDYRIFAQSEMLHNLQQFLDQVYVCDLYFEYMCKMRSGTDWQGCLNSEMLFSESIKQNQIKENIIFSFFENLSFTF